jgi:hypothetical protein
MHTISSCVCHWKPLPSKTYILGKAGAYPRIEAAYSVKSTSFINRGVNYSFEIFIVWAHEQSLDWNFEVTLHKIFILTKRLIEQKPSKENDWKFLFKNLWSIIMESKCQAIIVSCVYSFFPQAIESVTKIILYWYKIWYMVHGFTVYRCKFITFVVKKIINNLCLNL